MENTLSIVGSICSILSLIVALVIANKVIKIKNTINQNNSENRNTKTKNSVRGNKNIISGNDTNITK